MVRIFVVGMTDSPSFTFLEGLLAAACLVWWIFYKRVAATLHRLNLDSDCDCLAWSV